MKFAKQVLLLILIIILCGCSAVPDLTGTEYQHFTIKGKSCVKPFGKVLFPSDNEFIDFVSNPIEFQSYEEMANDVLTANFTEEEMNSLLLMCTGVGYYRLAFDVNNPPVVVLPESWNLQLSKLEFTRYGFKVTFRSDKTEKAVVCTFDYSFQDQFRDYAKNFEEFKDETFVKRVISNNDTTLYLCENLADERYSDCYVHGKNNGMAFEIEFFNSAEWLGQMPTDAELLQIDIQLLDLKS